MLNLDEVIKDTLPNVKNASTGYLKVLNLKVGEFADISPGEIPSSYYSVKKITNFITKQYGFLYGVRKLQHSNGWRVVRVENLEMLKLFPNFRTKLHKMENQAPNKNNNFSDADLAQTIDQKIILATRDSADLIPRGVTAARLTALQTANDAFKIMPTDEELEGDVGIAVETKNTARGKIESRIGNVRTMAQNIFGETSAEYRSFGFLGMVSLPDNDLSRISKIVQKRAVKYQANLLPEGCTPAFLTALDGEVTDFDGQIDAVKTAEKDRLEGTGKRILAGNTNYTETEKICNTAKDVYRETDPIKHDEYLMYPTGSGTAPLLLNGSINSGQVLNVNALIADPSVFTPATQIKMKNTSPNAMNLTFYSASNPGDGPGPGVQYTLAKDEVVVKKVADFKFELWPQFNIYNPNGIQGFWEIVVTN